jgi:hypothetical protein
LLPQELKSSAEDLIGIQSISLSPASSLRELIQVINKTQLIYCHLLAEYYDNEYLIVNTDKYNEYSNALES